MPEFPAGTLEAFGLYLLRTSALVLGAPLFGGEGGFAGHKLALIVATALLLYAAGGAPLPEGMPPALYGLCALRELLVGGFLALTLHLALLAIRVAGHMIGHEMMFSMSTLVDPVTGVNTPLVTRIYETLFYLGLLAVDGHHWLLRALGDSFARAPVGALRMDAGVLLALRALFAEMFAAGLAFGAPALVLLGVVSVMLGLLARAVPQLNVLEVGFTLRIGVGLVSMYLFAPLVAPALEALYTAFQRGLAVGVEALAG